jgi:hypothetical protein
MFLSSLHTVSLRTTARTGTEVVVTLKTVNTELHRCVACMSQPGWSTLLLRRTTTGGEAPGTTPAAKGESETTVRRAKIWACESTSHVQLKNEHGSIPDRDQSKHGSNTEASECERGGEKSVLSRPSTATCSARHGGVHSYCSWDRDGGGELAFAIAIAATATCIWPRTSVYLLSTICSATGTPPSNRLGRPQCRRIQMRMRPGHATEMFGQLVSLRRWFNHGSFQGSLRVIVDPLFCSCRSWILLLLLPGDGVTEREAIRLFYSFEFSALLQLSLIPIVHSFTKSPRDLWVVQTNRSMLEGNFLFSFQNPTPTGINGFMANLLLMIPLLHDSFTRRGYEDNLTDFNFLCVV